MHTLANHDYFIARRAFFFDLSPWGDEAPTDDPGQKLGLDKTAFLEVMRALYDRTRGGIIKIGGFTPWPYKYTSHAQPPGKYDGVPTEWEFGRLISQFNGYMEADAAGLAGMGNASFYRHYPLQRRYPQPNPKPGPPDWKSRGYLEPDGSVARKLFLGHYVGDYDAPSWLYKAVPRFFRDPARGRVPLGWAFDPNLADRAPQALVYAYRNARPMTYSSPEIRCRLPERSGAHDPTGLRMPSPGCEGAKCRTISGGGNDITASFWTAPAARLLTGVQGLCNLSPMVPGNHFEKGPRFLLASDLPEAIARRRRRAAKVSRVREFRPENGPCSSGPAAS